MNVKIGYFTPYTIKESNKQTLVNLKKQTKITYDDKDLVSPLDMQKFVEFASVELALNSLKCGPKYRNVLNALLFKKTQPHYVGKIKIIIRINKEKTPNNIYTLKLTQFCNVK